MWYVWLTLRLQGRKKFVTSYKLRRQLKLEDRVALPINQRRFALYSKASKSVQVSRLGHQPLTNKQPT